MTDQSNIDLESEETRIKSAYARRGVSSLYSWFDHGYLFYMQQLERRVLNLIYAEDFYPLHEKKILEIGCGQGNWLREFIKWGASPNNLAGIDLLPDRIEKARQLCPQNVELRCGNACELPFENNSLDVVAQFTVFSSILDIEMKKTLASEMLRVVKTEGFILWYDFYVDNPRNRDTRGIRKSDIVSLFPECRIQLNKVSLLPPLTRVLAPWAWLSCYLLEQLGILNTHYLGTIKKGR